MSDETARIGARVAGPRWLRFGPRLLLLLTVLVYVPALGGGFLNWDDPWLLESNSALRHPSLAVLWAIWTDLSLSTRYVFGAEYLPLRDCSHLFEAWVTGIAPLPLRVVNLLLYLGVVQVVQRLMLATLRNESYALVATAAFALHPVHVESVAWIAGRKDLLAMLFAALAMQAYVRRRAHCALWTVFWFLLAMLSKSMSVALPLCLPLFDIWMKRRPYWRAIGATLLGVALVMPLHLYVGHLVGMTEPRPGGSVSTALATMGPVWLRYVGVLLWPPACSLVQEVPTRTVWAMVPLLGYAAIVGMGLAALWQWRKGRSEWFVALGFWLVPLLPVSQVIAPLQNRMADRYLWWSVMALAVLLVGLLERWPRAGGTVALLVLLFWSAVTAQRAALFGDSALVFADATNKTTRSGIAPYQLAMALEAEGAIDRARAAYEEVWRRSVGRDDSSRRATNNLARLEARQGKLERAEWVLRRGLRYFPEDPVMQGNLAKVLAKQQLSDKR
jgi:protein O-mannosyl-transferase